MNKKKNLFLALFCIFVNCVFADILPPPEPEPLVKDEYIYKRSEVSTGDYFYGMIKIESTGEKKYIYEVPVYSIKLNRMLEGDVQWKFITKMEFKNDEIITIENSNKDVYEFNINTYEVKCVSNPNQKIKDKSYNSKIKTRFLLGTKYTQAQPEKKELTKIEDVISVAENVLFSVYGEERIKDEMPYRIFRLKNKWYVQGMLAEQTKGGVFQIIINAETSKIELISHGK